jgi:hypothetical protein
MAHAKRAAGMQGGPLPADFAGNAHRRRIVCRAGAVPPFGRRMTARPPDAAAKQEADMLKEDRCETIGTRTGAWIMAALTLSLGACDDNGTKTGSSTAPNEERRAESPPPTPPQTAPAPRTTPDRTEAPPPSTSPGAAPSASRLIGTWTVTEFKGGPADGRSDRSETTTYRFEDGGRVTVAGSKQCAYSFQEMKLEVDCNGQTTAGKIEFRGDQTLLWSVGPDQIVTLTKR